MNEVCSFSDVCALPCLVHQLYFHMGDTTYLYREWSQSNRCFDKPNAHKHTCTQNEKGANIYVNRYTEAIETKRERNQQTNNREKNKSEFILLSVENNR